MAEMATNAADTRSVPQHKQPRNPISRKQVERVISRSVAVFGIVFGAQTVPWLLGQLDEALTVWLVVVVPATFGSLVVALVASIMQRWVRAAHSLVSLVYLVALASWPFAVLDIDLVFTGPHWLYYLLTVATATAAIAFSRFVATVYLFCTPVVYFFGRISAAGGGASWELAALETVYAIILGGAVMIIVTMLRQAAASVDAAQATALDRYSHAVRQHATEVERVQVDSIVHDSVLTTLISAARAYTSEARELAATMASNAIGHLQAAALGTPDGGLTRLSSVADRIRDAAIGMSPPFDVRSAGVGTASIPAQAADAVSSAAIQAMVNSIQHAGNDGVSRWVSVRGIPLAGIQVVIGDAGGGFDLDSVPSERLGVRVSILERVAGAGGIAEVDSAPGQGTVITITWPSASETDSRVSGLPEDRA